MLAPELQSQQRMGDAGYIIGVFATATDDDARNMQWYADPC
jgi:hypothetical protein